MSVRLLVEGFGRTGDDLRHNKIKIIINRTNSSLHYHPLVFLRRSTSHKPRPLLLEMSTFMKMNAEFSRLVQILPLQSQFFIVQPSIPPKISSAIRIKSPRLEKIVRYIAFLVRTG